MRDQPVIRDPQDLLRDPEVIARLSDAVTLLREKDYPEAAALLAVLIGDQRAPELWEHMEECKEKGWN